MDMKVCLVLVILGASWCCSARDLASSVPSTETVDIPERQEVQAVKVAKGNDIVCTMCEEFTNQALNYLNNNKTQEEIIGLLLKSCAKLRVYEQQCVTLVNYYGPLFFLELSSIQPQQFCQEVALCQKVAFISQQVSNNTCNLCHYAVSEVLMKLKDPDTQLEVLELLLKACDSAKNYAQKCKKLVFEYAPVILINAEQFLEATDVCTILHACDSPAAVVEQALPVTDASMHSAS
nr:prosaposin [Ipomoea batatas]